MIYVISVVDHLTSDMNLKQLTATYTFNAFLLVDIARFRTELAGSGKRCNGSSFNKKYSNHALGLPEPEHKASVPGLILQPSTLFFHKVISDFFLVIYIFICFNFNAGKGYLWIKIISKTVLGLQKQRKINTHTLRQNNALEFHYSCIL